MTFAYFLDLVKSPKREKMLALLKMMMVQLRGHSINAKYPREILRMLIQQYSVMGIQEACQVFRACFVNLHGKHDTNVPADLVQEWNVRESKKHIKHMFSNKQEANINNRTAALPSIHEIADNFDKEAGTVIRASRHQEKSNDMDELIIMDDMHILQPFSHVEGRYYHEFKNISKSLSQKVDGQKLHRWFLERKDSFMI